MPGAHRLHGERRAHRTVAPATDCGDDPATSQRLADLDAEGLRDPSRFRRRVELQPIYNRGGHRTSPALRESSASPASPIAKFEPESDIGRATHGAGGTPAIGQRDKGFRRADTVSSRALVSRPRHTRLVAAVWTARDAPRLCALVCSLQ